MSDLINHGSGYRSRRFEYRYYAIRRPGDQKPSVYCGEFDGPNCFEYGHYDSMAQARAVALFRNLRRGARGCGARAWYYTPGAIIVRWWERRKNPPRYLLVGEPGYGKTYGPEGYHLFGSLGPITLDIETYADIYFGNPSWWEWRKRRAKTRERRKWKAEKFSVLYGGDAMEYEYDGRTLDGLLALREDAENIAMESGDKRPSDSLGVLPEHEFEPPPIPINFPCTIVPVLPPVERVKNFMVQAQSAERMELERRLGLDPDYSCGATYCDDPMCNTHGPRSRDD